MMIVDDVCACVFFSILRFFLVQSLNKMFFSFCSLPLDQTSLLLPLARFDLLLLLYFSSHTYFADTLICESILWKIMHTIDTAND